jgi:hypothetical protein
MDMSKSRCLALVVLLAASLAGCMAQLAPREPDLRAVDRSGALWGEVSREWDAVRGDVDRGAPVSPRRVVDAAEMRWVAMSAGILVSMEGFSGVHRDEGARRLEWCEEALAARRRGDPLPKPHMDWSRDPF